MEICVPVCVCVDFSAFHCVRVCVEQHERERKLRLAAAEERLIAASAAQSRATKMK